MRFDKKSINALEQMMNRLEIVSLAELERIIDDYDENCMFVMTVYSFLEDHGLTEKFKHYLKEKTEKDIIVNQVATCNNKLKGNET